MIRRRFSSKTDQEDVEPKGFDDFDLNLGDVMRGERATLGKSLLDVQRELRIKASYIAAIENCDPSAFDTPGFIAGYVRSYARYLGMDPDQAFASFCTESGFSVAHGMSVEASVVKKAGRQDRPSFGAADRDPFASPALPFAPRGEAFWSQIDPRALASVGVLMALIGAIGFGGWTVLKEVQRVQVVPVEQTPVILTEIDPLAGVENQTRMSDLSAATSVQSQSGQNADALNRLYRPQALDVPVLSVRDTPIATLDPNSNGNFAQEGASPAPAVQPQNAPPVPQVVAGPAPELRLVAVRSAWVRVSAANGSVLYEGVMERGDSYTVPATQEPPTLRVGESSAIFFAMNGTHYGPVGPRGAVTSDVALSTTRLAERYDVADLNQHGELARLVAELQSTGGQ